jgi:hypothetical protein
MHHWPNLFIAGAPRCGTSSLHSYLQGIPGIFMSRIKEPNYFSRVVIGDRHPMVKPIRNQDRYLRLFDEAGDAKIIGEATPFYLEDPEAPKLIHDKVPEAKVILSLRDPVERLYSHYLMMRNNRRTMGSFMQEIERGLAHQGERDMAVLAPTTGLYSRQVARYLRIFGEDRVYVLILEEWARDVPRALAHILKFLGVDHDCGEFAEPPQRRYAEARGPVVRYLFGNRTISRATEAMIPYRLRKLIRNAFLVKRTPKPVMDDEARNFLVQYYREDVRRLELLLGRRLPWRNFRSRGSLHH